MTDRILNTILRFTTDKQVNDQTLNQMRNMAETMEKRFGAVRFQVEETKRKMNELRETSERLTSISMVITGLGASLTGPIVLAARSYSQYAGMAEKTSRNWLTQTTRIEQAQLRIGRAGAQAVLPFMEKAADLATKVAKVADQHPEAIKAVLGVGVGITAIGALGMAVSKGVRIYADAKTLAAAGQQMAAAVMMKKAADAQLAAATGMNLAAPSSAANGAAAAGAGGVLGSLISKIKDLLRTPIGGATGMNARLAMATGTSATSVASIGAGILPAIPPLVAVVLAVLASQEIKNYIQNRKIEANPEGARKELDLLKLYRTGATLSGDQKKELEGYVRPLRGGTYTQAAVDLRVDARIKQLEGSLEKLGDAAKDTSEEISDLASQQGVQMYIQYKREEKQAEDEYGRQRSQIVENYAKQRVQIEQNYELQRTQLVEQFSKQQAQALEAFNFSLARQARDFQAAEAKYEEEYYKSRSEAAAGFNEETQRMEEDHQRRMRELRKDHEARMEDLVASRDALGMVREMRSYERARKGEEENYKIEAARRKQDFAKQMAEMENQFAEARAERLENYEQQLADQKEDFARQQEQAKEAMEEQLKQLEDQKRRELELLKKSEQEELQLLKTEYDRQKQLRRTALADELRLMEGQFGQMTAATEKFWEDMTAGFNRFYDNLKNEASNLPGYGTGTSTTTGTLTGKAAGGYATYGEYRLGEQGTEYVLNAKTTRAAEAIVKGKLTQERLVAAMVSGASGGSSQYRMTLQQNFSFAGSLTEQERQWFRRTAYEEAENAFLDAIRTVEG